MTYSIDLSIDGMLTQEAYASFTEGLLLAYGAAPRQPGLERTASGLVLPTGYDGDIESLAKLAQDPSAAGYLLDVPQKEGDDNKVDTSAGGIITYQGSLDDYIKDTIAASGVSEDLADHGGMHPMAEALMKETGDTDYISSRQAAARVSQLAAAERKLERDRSYAVDVNIWADAPTYTGWRGDDLAGPHEASAYKAPSGTTTAGGIYIPGGDASDVDALLQAELEAQGVSVDPGDYSTLDPMAAAILTAGGHGDIVQEKQTAARLAAYKEGFDRVDRNAREARKAEASSLELALTESFLFDAQGRMTTLDLGFDTGSYTASLSVRDGLMSITIDGIADAEAARTADHIRTLYNDACGTR